MSRNLLFVLAFIAVLEIGAPAFAHHGGAAFDQTKTQTLQGKVTQLDFVNPHVVVWFDVTNPDGTTTKWSGWLTAPNKLQRAGWTKHTLSPRGQGNGRRQSTKERQPCATDPAGCRFRWKRLTDFGKQLGKRRRSAARLIA